MNIIFETLAGSRLYGTNLPSSDYDYRGVFLPTKEEILLGKAKDSVHLGDDKQYFSLNKFMKMIAHGDPAAIEMLFAPSLFVRVARSPWDILYKNRKELLHKNMTGILGYCRAHTCKLAIKGTAGEAKKLLFDKLESYNAYSRLEDHILELKELERDSLFIQVTDSELVLDKKHYPLLTKVHSLRDRLANKYTVDTVPYKDLMHTVRLLYEAIFILGFGELSFPLSMKDDLIRVRKGEAKKEEVFRLIHDLLIRVNEWEEASTLPEKLDEQKWCHDFVMEQYMEVVNAKS